MRAECKKDEHFFYDISLLRTETFIFITKMFFRHYGGQTVALRWSNYCFFLLLFKKFEFFAHFIHVTRLNISQFSLTDLKISKKNCAIKIRYTFFSLLAMKLEIFQSPSKLVYSFFTILKLYFRVFEIYEFWINFLTRFHMKLKKFPNNLSNTMADLNSRSKTVFSKS